MSRLSTLVLLRNTSSAGRINCVGGERTLLLSVMSDDSGANLVRIPEHCACRNCAFLPRRRNAPHPLRIIRCCPYPDISGMCACWTDTERAAAAANPPSPPPPQSAEQPWLNENGKKCDDVLY